MARAARQRHVRPRPPESPVFYIFIRVLGPGAARPAHRQAQLSECIARGKSSSPAPYEPAPSMESLEGIILMVKRE